MSVSEVYFGHKFHQVKKICAEDGPREAAPAGAAALRAPDLGLQTPALHLPPEEPGALRG